MNKRFLQKNKERLISLILSILSIVLGTWLIIGESSKFWIILISFLIFDSCRLLLKNIMYLLQYRLVEQRISSEEGWKDLAKYIVSSSSPRLVKEEIVSILETYCVSSIVEIEFEGLTIPLKVNDQLVAQLNNYIELVKIDENLSYEEFQEQYPDLIEPMQLDK